MTKRAILLILDSLGIGAMHDVPQVRPRDIGAHTFHHILDQAEKLEIPNLEKLGINQLLHHPRLQNPKPLASWGSLNLQHEGADSYAGHQEIMGTRPRKPIRKPFVHILPQVQKTLERKGYQVEVPRPDLPYLWVNNAVVIGDNIETDYGQIYNVSGALDVIPFEEVLEIGNIVRREVQVSRVIALGGNGVSPKGLQQSVERREDGLVGLNSPKSGVYNKNYQARHLGYGVNPNKQIPTLLIQNSWPVHLIGKMQDVITCEGAETFPGVNTEQVMRDIENSLNHLKRGLIAATVQETDLAGHAEDVNRYAQKIMQVDQHLGLLLPQMGQDDLLLISADHGNDPTVGHSQHTREQTFVLAYNKKLPAISLGSRATLSDLAATLAQFFNTPPPENGNGFYEEWFQAR